MTSIFKIISIVIVSSLASTVSASAEGDIASGEKLFKKKCRTCHAFQKGKRAKLGPNLFGVYNSKAGQAEKFKYSDGLRAAGLTWDDETLHSYLTNPFAVTGEKRMVIMGGNMTEEADRNDMIEYLKSLSE